MKICTLNLNYYGKKYGTWKNRKETIIRNLARLNPDIVALQAVAKDPAVENGVDQAAQIAERLDFPYRAFRAAARHNGREEGQAVLCKMPIVEIDHLILTMVVCSDTNRRILMHTRFVSPNGPFHLFNAHFSWVPEQTCRNIDESLSCTQAAKEPALLVGDFNTQPDSLLFERLRNAGWVDAWQQLHADHPGHTFEANGPSIRVDYVLANAPLKDTMRSIEIVMNDPPASDHFGLLCTFDL